MIHGKLPHPVQIANLKEDLSEQVSKHILTL